MNKKSNPKVHKIDKTTKLSAEDYENAIATLKAFTKIALTWMFRKSRDDVKHQIIANFIARGSVCLDSIHILWKSGNYQDCWILHRALVDRLIHLRSLIDHDEFEEFERWSFQRQYQSAEAALSDQSIVGKMTPEALTEAKRQQNERRHRISQEPKSNWRRPDAKEAAKNMNLSAIYSLGYNPASGEVHPMADDGKEEFHDLLGIPLETYGDDRTVLHNSIVTQFLVVHYGMSGCDLLWRGFVSDFMEHWLSFVENVSKEELAGALLLLGKDQDVSWCEPRSDGDNR